MDDVDRFVANLAEPWPRDAVADLVGTIRGAGALTESIKWGNPFFARDGRAVVKLFVAQGWVDVFFYAGARLRDPDGILEPGGSSAMRRLQVAAGSRPPAGLAELVRDACSPR